MARVSNAFVRAPPVPAPVDAALALLFAAVALLELWLGGYSGPTAAKATAVVLTTLPLAWRTAASVTAVVLTVGGFALATLMGVPADEPVVPPLAPLLAVYSVGAHADARGLVAGGAAAIAGYSVAELAGTGGQASSIGVEVVVVLGALAVGRAVRVMGFETDTLEARATELECERDEQARAAVAAERARIARELHDVIGHSISVMGVQAGAVRRRLGPELERERAALLAVERSGRDAVAEMRRLLGFLRSDDEQAPVGAPPTLQRVDELVTDMRRAGLDIDLQVEGELDNLSPGRGLVAFRILQEALTNVLKHAPGAHVRATLRHMPSELEIAVVDDGDARSASSDGGGQGLVGMRERVALYGGTLEAGPRDERGFSVVARLPTGGS